MTEEFCPGVRTPAASVARMPNRPATQHRSVRVPDELWEAAKRVAADRGESVSAVINRALQRYVRNHPLPEPPERDQD